MKAYFFNQSQIARMAEVADQMHRQQQSYGFTPLNLEDAAERIVKNLDDAKTPIELDEASISELNTSCRFIPKPDIIGFVTKDGYLKGVFIKE